MLIEKMTGVVEYMTANRINIDRTKILFEEMLNDHMRQINIENVLTGRQLVENLIQQIGIPHMQRNYLHIRPPQVIAGPPFIARPAAQPGRAAARPSETPQPGQRRSSEAFEP
jgi:hypothetical protein